MLIVMPYEAARETGGAIQLAAGICRVTRCSEVVEVSGAIQSKR